MWHAFEIGGKHKLECIEQLQKDTRFKINPMTLQNFKKRKLISYQYIEIPIGKIRRHQDGKVFSLYETDAYRYLANPNGETKSQYARYAANPINQKDHPNRSVEDFDNLKEEFTQYDPLKGVIVVNQFYCVMDGQHRSCILLNLYGESYRIPVVKIRFGDYKLIGKIRINNFLYNIKQFFKK